MPAHSSDPLAAPPLPTPPAETTGSAPAQFIWPVLELFPWAQNSILMSDGPLHDSAGPAAKTLALALDEMGKKLRSNHTSQDAVRVAELLRRNTLEALAAEDRNRYSAYHYETFCDIVAAYQLLVLYSPAISSPPASMANAMPPAFRKRLATLHKKFIGTGKRLSDWAALVDQGLTHIRSVNEVLGANSTPFQSTGPFAGIKNMRNLGRMSAGLGLAENFLYAGFHIWFLLNGACVNLNTCPDILIPGFPSNVDKIIAESERTIGQILDEGDRAYLRELFTPTSTSAFEVKLPLLFSLAASPAVLNLPFRISKSGASKSTVVLLSAFRGNDKPVALQQTEDILWPLLKDFFQCQEPLFAVLQRACESFPWEHIRALSNKERAWIDPGILSKDEILALNPISSDPGVALAEGRTLRKRKDRPDCPQSDGAVAGNADIDAGASTSHTPQVPSTKRIHIHATPRAHAATAPRRSTRDHKRAKGTAPRQDAAFDDNPSTSTDITPGEGSPMIRSPELSHTSSATVSALQPLGRTSSESTIATQDAGSIGETSFTIRDSSFNSRMSSPRPTTLSGLDAFGDVKVIENPPLSPRRASSTIGMTGIPGEFASIGSQKLPIDVDQLDRYLPSLAPLLETGDKVIGESEFRYFPFTANGLGPDFGVRCHNPEDARLVTNVIYQVECLYDEMGFAMHMSETRRSQSMFLRQDASELLQLRSRSARDIQSTLRRWWIVGCPFAPGTQPMSTSIPQQDGCVSVEPTLAAFLNEIEPFGNIVEIHDQSISIDPHTKTAICHGTVDQLILTKQAKEKMKVLSIPSIPSWNTDQYDPIYASETWAYFATHARRTSLRWKPSPAQALSFNGVALKGTIFPFQIPPDGLGVALTVRMGELFTVLCRPETVGEPVDELSRPDYLLHLDPYHSVVGSSEYEAVLLTSGNTGDRSIILHPGTLHFLYAASDVIFHRRFFYSVATMRETYASMIQSFVLRSRVTVDVGTSISSRHYLCRMMMFWYDVLVDGKHTGSNPENALRHVPTLDSFESVLDLLALVSLSMFANVLDERTYTEEEVPRHDRALYIAARRAAMLTVRWFFATYELFDTSKQAAVDGYAKIWYPMLGTQATALLQFKGDADMKHRFDPTHSACNVDDVREQLQYVVDIYPPAGEHFDPELRKPSNLEPQALTYLTSVSCLVYEVRRRTDHFEFYQDDTNDMHQSLALGYTTDDLNLFKIAGAHSTFL